MRPLKTLVLVASLALTACSTIYGPKGLTGGFTDQQVDNSTYLVTFAGNGKTSSDMVWNYWIYRCAEITRQKGFTAFHIAPAETRGGMSSGYWATDMTGRSDRQPSMTTVAGKGGTTYYYYVPGSTVTTYRASGTVRMFSRPYPAGAYLLDAEKILATLKPFVDSGGKAQTGSRKEIIDAAMIMRGASL